MAASVLEIYIDGEKVLLYFNDFEMTWGACMEITQNISAGFSVDENGYVLYQNRFLVKEGSTQYITTSDYINGSGDSYQTVKPAKHGAYIGASGVARKVKKIYVGVNGAARKVKKAYIGVGGVARLCFSGEPEVKYYGTLANLQKSVRFLSATSIGNYALFAGGLTNAEPTNALTVYDNSFVKFMTGTLSGKSAASSMAAASNPKYAIFSGGETSSGSSRTSIAYDAALTKTSPDTMYEARCRHAGGSIGNYAVFAGGYYSGYLDSVESYDDSLTHNSSIERLWVARDQICAATAGNYIMFAGGYVNGNAKTTIDAYNTSLTRVSSPSFTYEKSNIGAVSFGNYALFPPGEANVSATGASTTIECYDSSLTKVMLPSLPEASVGLKGASVNEFALLGGGYRGASNEGSNKVYSFDNSLTLKEEQPMTNVRYQHAATTVGNAVLFGGGFTTGSYTTASVEAYQVV